MTGRAARDRAAVAIGAVSVVSVLFAFLGGDVQLVWMPGAAVAVALVLGLFAGVAGWLGNRLLILAGGVAYLLAAAVLMVLLAGPGDFLIGNGSTFSMWLGLGCALMALGLPDRSESPSS